MLLIGLKFQICQYMYNLNGTSRKNSINLMKILVDCPRKQWNIVVICNVNTLNYTIEDLTCLDLIHSGLS